MLQCLVIPRYSSCSLRITRHALCACAYRSLARTVDSAIDRCGYILIPNGADEADWIGAARGRNANHQLKTHLYMLYVFPFDLRPSPNKRHRWHSDRGRPTKTIEQLVIDRPIRKKLPIGHKAECMTRRRAAWTELNLNAISIQFSSFVDMYCDDLETRCNSLATQFWTCSKEVRLATYSSWQLHTS